MKSGIYIIKNKKKPSDFYIGSSINIKKRWSEHKRNLRKNKHHSPILQNAWNKYKEPNFRFMVLEVCIPEKCLNIEQKYLNKYKPVYNIALSSSAPMLGKKHTAKTIKKMQNKIVPSGKQHHLYGTKWSKSLRKKILKARIGGKRSEKTKQKQRIAAIKRNSYITLLPYIEKRKKQIKDSNGNLFKSLTEAAKYWGVSVATICDCLKGRSITVKGKVQFKYENDKTPFNNLLVINRWKEKVNSDMIIRIIKFKKEGYKIKEIATKLKIHKSSVDKTLAKYKNPQLHTWTR